MRKKIIVFCIVSGMFLNYISPFKAFAGEPSPWAKEGIEKAHHNALSLSAYDYREGIYRCDMAELVGLLLKKELAPDFLEDIFKTKDHPFQDIQANHYYINLCYKTGIIMGTGPETFSPYETLTREQAAVIVIRAIKFIETKRSVSYLKTENLITAPGFSDKNKISSWALESIYIAEENNILQGDNGFFNPLKNVSYEEAIILIYNTYDMFNKQGLLLSYTKEELDRMKYIADQYKSLLSLDSLFNEENRYLEKPSLIAPYQMGRLQDEYIKTGIQSVNLARYIAGLPENVQYNSSLRDITQCAALIAHANGYLSHHPEKPQGMADKLYDLALKGSSGANLSGDYSLFGSTWSYMDDSDDTNIGKVAHRRWILDPTLHTTAFGQSGRFCAMYVLDTANTEEPFQNFVAWPSGMFPLEVMPKHLAWSVSVPDTYIADKSNITVQIVRERDNKKWLIDSGTNKENGGFFNINTENYGSGQAIIFRPEYLLEKDLYAKEDVFSVEIKGLVQPLTYNIRIFSADDRERMNYTKDKQQ